MLRSLFIFMIIIGTVPMILIKPHVGLLVWSWMSYMNPHKLAHGFIQSLPMLDLVAGATIVAWLVSKEPKRIPGHPIVIVMTLFLLWTVVTTLLSVDMDRSLTGFELQFKIILLCLISAGLITNRKRVDALMLVIVLSLGFYGAKGGLFTLLRGGRFIVGGPGGTFIGDNNHLALALLMIIPLLRYVSLHAPIWIFRRGAFIGIPFVALAVVGSQSRGALVGGLAMLPFLIGKGRRRILTIILLLLGLPLLYNFMPQSWHDRMETTLNYEEDASASSRIYMWQGAWRVAADRPLWGAGFDSNYDNSFMLPYLNGEKPRAYHSIWYMVLGEHGFIGLFLFLLLATTTYFTANETARLARGRPDMAWAVDLSKMIQVSLIGYFAAGSFLSLAKFDLFYQLCIIVMLAHLIIVRKLAESEDAQVEAATPARKPIGAARPAPAE